MKEFNGFRLASHDPLTEAECGWIDILRALFPKGIPAPDLRSAQAVRRVLAKVFPGGT